MRTKLAAVVAAVGAALVAVGTPSWADDKLTYSFTPQGTSDYIFRGLSYSSEQPAVQTYVEVNYNIFYAAFWTSRTDYLGVYGPWEFDTFLGARPVTGPITWDVGVWWYNFGSKDPVLTSGDLDYFEFKLGASITPVENVTLNVTGYYTPDQDLAVVDTKTIEGSLSYVLPQVGQFTPTLSGLVGWAGSDTDGFFLGKKDYVYWNGGVKLNVEKFFMDFRYWDTTIGHDFADERFVFTAGVSLP